MSASQRLVHFVIAVFGAAGADFFWDECYTTLRRYTTLSVTLVTHSLTDDGSGMRNIPTSVAALTKVHNC